MKDFESPPLELLPNYTVVSCIGDCEMMLSQRQSMRVDRRSTQRHKRNFCLALVCLLECSIRTRIERYDHLQRQQAG